MPNPNSITLNLETDLGDAIKQIIHKTPYGYSTFIVKEFMQNHEQELRGILGNERFEELLKKWSIVEQEQIRIKKDRKIKQYMNFGYSEERAKELVELFPDMKPIEVVKLQNSTANSESFKKQTDYVVENAKKQKLFQNPDYRKLKYEKTEIEQHLKDHPEDKPKFEKRLSEIETKMKQIEASES
jgi:hypothetical protein